MIKKTKYLLEALGGKKLGIYLLLRPFRKFLSLKDTLLYTYREISYAKSIYESIVHNNIKSDKIYDRKIEHFYSTYGKKINKNWHYCYAHSNGIKSEKYIPLLNYTDEIEPVLNRMEFAEAYDDKNLYGKMFKNILMPECLVRCMNGVYFDRNYQKIDEPEDAFKLLDKDVPYIIKPSVNSQGGYGIYMLTYDGKNVLLDNTSYSVKELSKKYRKDFVIQKILKQHKDINKIYPHSINTIRVMTLRHSGKILILSHIIRFGAGGAFMDKLKTGGLSCGITSEGILKKQAVGKKLDVHNKHPDTGILFEGIIIPGFDKVKEMTITLHESLNYFNIVSWDFAINTEGDPVLIEMNLADQGINYLQALNGPLFGDLTDDILEEVYL